MVDFENKEHFKPILNTVKELLKVQKNDEIVLMLDNAEIYVSNTDQNCWNGVDWFGYTFYINISVSEFVKIDIESFEKQIKNALDTATRNVDDSSFTKVIISPKSDTKIDWSKSDLSKQDLIEKINYLKNTMISVSTGGSKIQSVEEQYRQIYNEIKKVLKKLDIENPNNYDSLWNWYGKWSNDFPTYQERRNYINGIFNQLLNILSDEDDTKMVNIKVDLSGWEKINRSIIEINKREKQAQNEEQYQAVGMLCREIIITLAQIVYDPVKHISTDGVEISKTDSMRMIDAYLTVILGGDKSAELRTYVKSTNKLANSLTHKRTATKKDMLLCTSAVTALVNIIGILEDKYLL
jgi:hypothetical protein